MIEPQVSKNRADPIESLGQCRSSPWPNNPGVLNPQPQQAKQAEEGGRYNNIPDAMDLCPKAP
jgi:hypothetical protein